MDKGAVMLATCLSAATASLIMGLWANLPVALAPGMGMNALVAFVICGKMGVPWQVALGMIFISGVIFLGLSLVRFRETLIGAIPPSIKFGAAAGIGLFIAFIGLQHAGLVVKSDATLVTRGPLDSWPILVSVIGLVLTVILVALKVKGAILLGLIGTGILAWSTGVISPPPEFALSLKPTFFRLDIVGPLKLVYIPPILTLLFFDMFDTVGTLVGVCEEAGLMHEGKIPNATRALASDAAGTVVGSFLGTSTVTSYIESASGVAAGGRTGLSSVFTAALFILSVALLYIWPQGAAAIGSTVPVKDTGLELLPVTAPALIVVGFLMSGALRKIDWSDFTEAFPAFLTLILMPLTFSISGGLAAGFLSCAFLKLVTGRGRELHPIVYVVSGLILVGYIVIRLVS